MCLIPAAGIDQEIIIKTLMDIQELLKERL